MLRGGPAISSHMSPFSCARRLSINLNLNGRLTHPAFNSALDSVPMVLCLAIFIPTHPYFTLSAVGTAGEEESSSFSSTAEKAGQEHEIA